MHVTHGLLGAAGALAAAILGSVNGLVTAYPLGTGVAKKWRQCAAS